MLVGKTEGGGVAVVPHVEGAAVELVLGETEGTGCVHRINIDVDVGIERAILVLPIEEEGTAEVFRPDTAEQVQLYRVGLFHKAESGTGSRFLFLVAEITGLRHTVTKGIVEIGIQVGRLFYFMEELHGREARAGLQGTGCKTGHQGA